MKTKLSKSVMTFSMMLSFLLLSLYLPCSEVIADDIEFQPGVTQSDLEKFSEEFGSALSYKALAPAEPLGILGFDVGLEITATDIDEGNDYWENVTEDNDMPELMPLAKIYARKGLPFGFDVGAVYGKVPDSNISLIGAEIKYAILEGTVATPAVAVRGSYTQLLGVDQLDFSTYGVDLSISKGFLNMTPYGGIGAVWAHSKPKSLPDDVDLGEENISLIRYFGGIRVTFLLLNITAEVDYMEVPTYSLRLGIVF